MPKTVWGSMSLYGDYVKEREGKSIIEDENGFATYQIQNGVCYIEHIFVKKEVRKQNIASKMADQIAVIAKENGCALLTGSVVPSAFGSTESLKVMLAYGFRLKSCTLNFIILEKEL